MKTRATDKRSTSFFGGGGFTPTSRVDIKEPGLFARIMEQSEVQSEQSHEDLTYDHLWLTLDSAERDLAEKPDRENFLRYRNAVRALTGQILKDSSRVVQIKGRNDRVYEIIKVIDANLNALLGEIVGRNLDALIALKLMGQIKGLLLDITG